MNCRFSIVPLVEEASTSECEELICIAIDILSRSMNTDWLCNTGNIQQIEAQLAKWKIKFYPGGQSAEFALKFELPKTLFPLIIKVYTKFNINQLAYHVLTSRRFLQEFCGGITAKERDYLIVPSKNILLSYSEELGAVFLIQNFSKGKIIDRSVPITGIVKVIAAKGFIVDPYPNNWRLISSISADKPRIEYIDTIFSNKLPNSSGVENLIAGLKNFEYQCTIPFLEI